MSKTKKSLIIGLFCLNLLLVAGLIHVNMSEAEAAGQFKSTDYVVTTCQVSGTQDALVVVDLASQKFAAWKWDNSAKQMVAIGGKDLGRDFKNLGK